MLRRLVFVTCFMLLGLSVKAQFTYGTTGLLHMPTADMQKDKTFMFGGSRLNSHAMPSAWYYHTYNYYIKSNFEKRWYGAWRRKIHVCYWSYEWSY